MNGFDPSEADMIVLPEGVTLRDWFAGRALQAQLSNPVMVEATLNSVQQDPVRFVKAMALGAYEWADAMLKAREEAR
jgi:hypothetical protein